MNDLLKTQFGTEYLETLNESILVEGVESDIEASKGKQFFSFPNDAEGKQFMTNLRNFQAKGFTFRFKGRGGARVEKYKKAGIRPYNPNFDSAEMSMRNATQRDLPVDIADWIVAYPRRIGGRDATVWSPTFQNSFEIEVLEFPSQDIPKKFKDQLEKFLNRKDYNLKYDNTDYGTVKVSIIRPGILEETDETDNAPMIDEAGYVGPAAVPQALTGADADIPGATYLGVVGKSHRWQNAKEQSLEYTWTPRPGYVRAIVEHTVMGRPDGDPFGQVLNRRNASGYIKVTNLDDAKFLIAARIARDNASGRHAKGLRQPKPTARPARQEVKRYTKQEVLNIAHSARDLTNKYVYGDIELEAYEIKDLDNALLRIINYLENN